MTKHRVLDHGYVGLVEKWGSDEAIIEAARMSTGKGFLGWGPADPHCELCGVLKSEGSVQGSGHFLCSKISQSTDHKWASPGDEKLLRFLYENKHSTPFEMAGMTIEVQAPIFVFREWHRHRVPFGYSEMSARYTPLPDMAYVPTIERVLVNSKTNKQAGTVKGADELTAEVAEELLLDERNLLAKVEDLYQRKLKAGFPKELARTHLTVSRYSRMRATGNLRGWLAFLTLRMAPGAQHEIRMYANVVGSLIEEAFPRTWELFAEKLP